MRLIVEQISRILEQQKQSVTPDPAIDEALWELVRRIVHDPALDRIVARTPTILDDLALKVLRVVVPKP